MAFPKRKTESIETMDVHPPEEFLDLVRGESIYLKLVRMFPLVSIESRREHKIASNVAHKLVQFLLQSIDLPVTTKKNIEAYLNTLSAMIEGYERKKFSPAGKQVKGVDVLKFLMEEHGLTQTDLKEELGGQSVVSELLKGKRGRRLNRNQIEALSKRFHLSPAVFFDRS